MPINNRDKRNLKRKLRVIILVLIGIVTFSVSVIINVSGMTSIINQDSDSSGMAGLSVRKSGTTSLGNPKETKVNKEGKIVEEDIFVNSVPIIKLNNNNWDRLKSKFSNFKLDENGNYVFEDGYTLYCNGNNVNYVVFNNNYTDEVVGYIKVGTDFKVIEEKLGIPTFRSNEYLGYKTKEVYVFFYNNEICVYPNKTMDNSNLENLFEQYVNKLYLKDRTYFVVDIRNNYDDFIIDIDNDSDTVILTSLLRRMVVKLDSIGNIEVELYNGYKIANESTKKLIEDKLYLTNEEDLVEIFENERISVK